MKLSKNLSLAEVVKSQTAIRKGIDNRPSMAHEDNLQALAQALFQPLRDWYGKPITISSGYRSPQLNEAIGGSSSSQHCKGQAADIEVAGVPNYHLAKWIKENTDFDQVILEFYTPGIPDSGWVHVSYNTEGNRGKSLTASRVDGKTQYSLGLNT